MNNKFLKLPLEKQRRILSAGYKVFSTYPYKKAPTSMIAEEACMSKSLLFHYFTNKKGYYLYLFTHAVEYLNLQIIHQQQENQSKDFFERMSFEMKRKVELSAEYPYLYQFIGRAYYERDESIQNEISKLYGKMLIDTKEDIKLSIDISKFKNPNEIDKLIDIITWIAEGYTYKNMNRIFEHPQEVVKEFQTLLDSLKMHYYKEVFINVLR
ncbi:TetR/AcrR family transcriptional regulator [Vallitalea okinawensis]|uniref:TetR/AcrR family transcriptional regulator n=1 Tax=Vallitalea okinawensis TaxID=2078660 RepID=UPI001478BB5C|nr:TetR/AcrR family transcriptional regulator [Vallitalea okinawensis]